MRRSLYTSSSSITKTEQENEALAHRFHMEIFQKGKIDLADEILTSDFVLRNPMLPSEFDSWTRRCKEICIINSRQRAWISNHAS